MLSYRALERITGILLIALIPAFILSTFAVSEVDTYEKSFRLAFTEIADDRTALMMGTGFLLVASLVWVALAALLYLVFRPHEPALALLGTFGFLAAGFAFMVGGFVGAGLIDLAGDYGKAGPTEAGAIVTSARPLAVILESALYIGAIIGLALSVLVFGPYRVEEGPAPRAGGTGNSRRLPDPLDLRLLVHGDGGCYGHVALAPPYRRLDGGAGDPGSARRATVACGPNSGNTGMMN